jgi:hypothetical protein
LRRKTSENKKAHRNESHTIHSRNLQTLIETGNFGKTTNLWLIHFAAPGV